MEHSVNDEGWGGRNSGSPQRDPLSCADGAATAGREHRPPSAPPLRAALGASDPCREVTLDGVRVTFDDEGRGQTVVCLHAIGHGARDFATFRERNRHRYRVLALDWPDHGRSAPDRIEPSSARYGEILAMFLDALVLDRPLLLGNSIGGAAALRVAAARPDRVRAVVVANPGGLVPHALSKRLVTGAVAGFFALGKPASRWYPNAFAALYRRILSEPPASEQRARIVAAWAESAPVLARAWRSFGQPDDDLSASLERISCPVLVTWSVGDRLNPLAFNRPGIGRLPKARLETFRGGHAPFLECPEEFDAAFERFVQGLP